MTPFHPARSGLTSGLRALVLIALLGLSFTAGSTESSGSAGPIPGQPLPTLNLKDQHDNAWQVPADTRLVLFAAGRKASGIVQAVLEKEPKDFLSRHHTVYLADLSQMPGLATRLFALPALREMPFRVGISLSEATLAGWPREPEGVALIELANGVVQRVGHARTEAELRAAIGP
jgi:hypothetical protein